LPAFGVLLPDLLIFSPHLQNIVLDLLHPPFVLHLAVLAEPLAQAVIGIATPFEQLLRRSLRLRQKQSPPRQR
jgi:hypothetical protein